MTAAGIANDPVPRFRQQLLAMQVSEATLAEIEAAIDKEIEEAVEFAMESPFPDVSELRIDVVAQEIAA
jgi:TPP-dependent pyruvate/acetoin dehydrogenase alpha subunit